MIPFVEFLLSFSFYLSVAVLIAFGLIALAVLVAMLLQGSRGRPATPAAASLRSSPA